MYNVHCIHHKALTVSYIYIYIYIYNNNTDDTGDTTTTDTNHARFNIVGETYVGVGQITQAAFAYSIFIIFYCNGGGGRG